MTSIPQQLSRCDVHGDTPLHAAARLDLFNHIQDLLEQGADPCARNRDGALAISLTDDPACRAALDAGMYRHWQRRGALRILIVGNTNNYPLLLAEGLRAAGHEVRLAITQSALRHRPESKYPDWAGNYPAWISDITHLELDRAAYDEDAVATTLSPLMDGIHLAILNDIGPSLQARISVPVMSMLTGSDLTYYASHRTALERCADWAPEFLQSRQGHADLAAFSRLVVRQRTGIKNSRLVSFAAPGLIPEGDELLQSIGLLPDRRTTILMADTISLRAQPLPDPAAPLRIFNGARIEWLDHGSRTTSRQDLKGTDILVRGFADYCRHGGEGVLHLVQKGPDVDACEKLIASLGIASRVVWLPGELSLSAYHDEVSKAHLVCDQLAQSFPGMVSLDAWAIGRPVMANFRNDEFGAALPAPLPGFQASSPSDVAAQLLRLDADRQLLHEMACRSSRYAENWLRPEIVADRIIDILLSSEPPEEVHVQC